MDIYFLYVQMLVIEADIHEYVGMSYVDKNILDPLVHMHSHNQPRV